MPTTISPFAAKSLFAVTVFLGAGLVFQIQPLMSKLILPWFGGSPGVWTVCLLFFQSRGGPDAALGVWVPWHKRLTANRAAEIFPLVALRPERSKPRPGHPANIVSQSFGLPVTFTAHREEAAYGAALIAAYGCGAIQCLDGVR